MTPDRDMLELMGLVRILASHEYMLRGMVHSSKELIRVQWLKAPTAIKRRLTYTIFEAEWEKAQQDVAERISCVVSDYQRMQIPRT